MRLAGRQEVWVLQAPARDVKETWITEIKRVLLNQFHQLKGQTMRQPSVTGSTPSGLPLGPSNNRITSTPNPGNSPYGLKYCPALLYSFSYGGRDKCPLPSRSIRPTSSYPSWEYSGNGTPGSSSSSSGVSSSMADSSTPNSSTATSRASSSSGGSRQMLRSSTTMTDEDDGWSTDFSLSDDEMGDAYLDHVEVRQQREDANLMCFFKIHFVFRF